MPTVSQALVAKLGLDQSEFRAGMRNAENTARSSGERISTAFNKVKVAVAAVGLAAAGLGGAFARSVIDAASTSENLRLRLDALLGSTQEGAKAFQQMSDFAATVPFQFEEIIGSATQLAGIVKGGADEISEIMPIIADLAAVSGLSIQQTTEQIVRSFSAGIGAADLFRERGITAMLGFQAGASVSAEETRDRIIAAFNDSESKFRGASERMAGTWDGLMSMLSDRWFQFRNLVAEAGLFDLAKDALEGLVNAADAAMARLVPIFRSGGDELRRLMTEIGILLGSALGHGILTGFRAIVNVIPMLLDQMGILGNNAITQQMRGVVELVNTTIDPLLERLTATGAGALAEIDAIAADATERLKMLEQQATQTTNAVARASVGAVGGGVSIGEVSGPPSEAATRIVEAAQQAASSFREANAQGAQLVMTIREVPALLELTDDEWQEYLASQNRAITLAEQWQRNMSAIGQTLANQVASGVAAMVLHLRSAADVLRSIVTTLLTQMIGALIRATAQALLFKSALGGPLGFSGFFLPGFQSGGMIPAPAGQAMPIMAHGGEAVLNRQAVQRLGGASAVNAINTGESGGGMPQTVVIEASVGAVPAPTDYNIVATSPDMQRFLAAAIRQLKVTGFRFTE